MSTYDEDSGAAPWQGSGGSQAPRTSRTPQAPQTWHDAEAAEAGIGGAAIGYDGDWPPAASPGGTWPVAGAEEGRAKL